MKHRRSGVDRRGSKGAVQQSTESGRWEPPDQTESFRKVVGLPIEGLPFSPAIMVGDMLFLSGSIGYDAEKKALVPGGIVAETRKAIENLRETLQEAGMGLENVVKVTVYLSDMADYETFNRVYAEYFPVDPPARETCAVSALAMGAKVELSFIAVKSS